VGNGKKKKKSPGGERRESVRNPLGPWRERFFQHGGKNLGEARVLEFRRGNLRGFMGISPLLEKQLGKEWKRTSTTAERGFFLHGGGYSGERCAVYKEEKGHRVNQEEEGKV